jgi:hypothetical protein
LKYQTNFVRLIGLCSDRAIIWGRWKYCLSLLKGYKYYSPEKTNLKIRTNVLMIKMGLSCLASPIVYPEQEKPEFPEILLLLQPKTWQEHSDGYREP